MGVFTKTLECDYFQIGGKPKQASAHSDKANHTDTSKDIRIASTPAKDNDTPAPVQHHNFHSTSGERNGNHTATTASTPAATVKNIGGGGFNIAEHLQKNAMDVALERTDGSLSPEMNQFLEDIGSVVPTLSPDHSQLKKEHTSPHHKLRPKIAANFGTSNATPRVNGQIVDTSNSHSPIPDSTTTTVTKALDPHVAASKIQQWYRENKSLKQSVQVHNLLASKRDELNRSKNEELQRIQLELEAREMKEREREKRRAAKMQAARRVAIEDLKRKREEKRERAEKIAQEEIVSHHNIKFIVSFRADVRTILLLISITYYYFVNRLCFKPVVKSNSQSRLVKSHLHPRKETSPKIAIDHLLLKWIKLWMNSLRYDNQREKCYVSEEDSFA